MPNLIASLSKNTLKLTINSLTTFQSASTQVTSDIVNDTKVLNANEFAQVFHALLAEFKDVKPKKLELIFLVEPSDVVLHFVTIDKNTEDVDTEATAKIKEKLTEQNIDELYFSYQKIAPFVYQVVGVKKEFIDTYLEVATSLQMNLKAVLPWVLLLPKFLDSNDPCVFLFENEGRQAVALSELNGIYFCEEFAKNKTSAEVKELIKTLSVYKRDAPISKIYTLNGSSFGFDKKYDVAPLINLSEKYQNAQGYEMHMLTEEILASIPNFTDTQANLLNLLPVPVVEKKNTTLVYVSAFVGAFVLVLAGFGAFNKLNQPSSKANDLALMSNESSAVLSDSDNISQSTEAVEDVQVEVIEKVTSEEELKKEDITIRVENGAGISGIAGETKKFLESNGWTVFNIGNAETSDATSTLLKFKTESLKYKDLLIKDMQKDYDLTVLDDALDDSEEFDVLVIVGSN